MRLKFSPTAGALLAVFALSVFPSVAFGGSVTVDDVTFNDPEEANSWLTSGGYAKNGKKVDHVQIGITSTYNNGQQFETPAIDSFANATGWSERANDGTLVIAEGNAADFFFFTLHFDGTYGTDSVEYNIEFYSGTTLMSSTTWDFDFSGASPVITGTLNTSSVMGGFQPVPEPATVLLFGLGAAGVAWRRRRSPLRTVRS